jgi:hypothetical protein
MPKTMDRREFLKTSTVAAASGIFLPGSSIAQLAPVRRIGVRLQAPESLKTRLAVNELCSGLHMLNRAWEIHQTTDGKNGFDLTLSIDASTFKGVEDYEIAAVSNGAVIRAGNEQALLYAVFEFLERQGMVFGLDGTLAPLEPIQGLHIPSESVPWTATPNFTTRGLLPWPDFLNCISVYNDEDYKAYFAAMLRMRFNMFGMHVYTQNLPLAESYLSFDFAGSGHIAALEDTTMTSWGYLPQRTSNYKMGAAEFFDRETFGADATRLAADNWDRADRTTAMFRKALLFAQQLGIRTGIGFEPYVNPDEIMTALPPESKSFPGGLVESRIGRDLLERRLADLLERYPMVDDVWLWQDEGSNWDSRKKDVALSVTPFMQAHEFLRKHAPNKRLVLGGWGGVARHFEDLHKRLPEDIVFSSLNDTLGWDPIGEVYSKLGNRERWPIPWLEDDPSMWFPQFRASHIQSDMQRARELGCQGMLGIHWRNRVVDPTATYFARAAWNKSLTSAQNYRYYCETQAVGARATELATIFEDADRHRLILSTFLGTYDKNGFAMTNDITADYVEAFIYDDSEPELTVLDSQRATASKLRELTARATSPLERDRIGYFSGFVNMMVPYSDAFETAHKIGAFMKQAVALREQKKEADARTIVMDNAVPLWLKMAPMVRDTMLTYQAVVTTRNDQGQLASMQNKFVRIALERLRLSIKEFVDELPPAMDAAYAAAISPASANPQRLFMPTRPSLLNVGDSVRIFIVAPGQTDVTDVKLYTRRLGEQQWKSVSADHAGRAVYTAQLGPFQASDATIEYYAAAPGNPSTMSAPPQAPVNLYTLNILHS